MCKYLNFSKIPIYFMFKYKYFLFVFLCFFKSKGYGHTFIINKLVLIC